MITKLESNTIKSMLNEKSTSKKMVSVSADKTTMKLSKSVYILLKYFHSKYKEQTGDQKIGMSSYIWILLKKFRDDQRALLRYSEIDHRLFDKSMLDALQTFKRICKDYVDKSVKSQSDAVLAILMYSVSRKFEIDNNYRTSDYLDQEYEDDMDEAKGLPVRVNKAVKPEPPSVPLFVIDKDLSELLEDDEPDNLIAIPHFSLRGEK